MKKEQLNQQAENQQEVKEQPEVKRVLSVFEQKVQEAIKMLESCKDDEKDGFILLSTHKGDDGSVGYSNVTVQGFGANLVHPISHFLGDARYKGIIQIAMMGMDNPFEMLTNALGGGMRN